MKKTFVVLLLLVGSAVFPANVIAQTQNYGTSILVSKALSDTNLSIINSMANINWPSPTLENAWGIEVRNRTDQKDMRAPEFGLTLEKADMMSTLESYSSGETFSRRGTLINGGLTGTFNLTQTRLQPFIGFAVGLGRFKRFYETRSTTGEIVESYSKDPIWYLWGRVLVGAKLYVVKGAFVSAAVGYHGNPTYITSVGYRF